MNGDDNVEARLQKWGNSDGIRIPSSILKTLNLKTNDTINLEQVEDKIIIELKAVTDLRPEHEWQLINYLAATHMELGLLINFGRSVKVRRKILTKEGQTDEE